MAKGSDNPFPSVLIVEGAEPSAPSAGQQRLYIDSTTHDLKRTNSSGVEVTLEGGRELDYVEFTSAVSPTGTTEGTASTVVTANAIAFDGTTKCMIEFFAPDVAPSNAGAGRNIALALFEDGTSIGYLAVIYTPAAGDDDKPVYALRRRTPTNASHTYAVKAFVSAGTGSVAAGVGGAGVRMPGFIRITKV